MRACERGNTAGERWKASGSAPDSIGRTSLWLTSILEVGPFSSNLSDCNPALGSSKRWCGGIRAEYHVGRGTGPCRVAGGSIGTQEVADCLCGGGCGTGLRGRRSHPEQAAGGRNASADRRCRSDFLPTIAAISLGVVGNEKLSRRVGR